MNEFWVEFLFWQTTEGTTARNNPEVTTVSEESSSIVKQVKSLMVQSDSLRDEASGLGQENMIAEINSYSRVLNKMLGSVTEGNFERKDVKKALEMIGKKFAAIDRSLKESKTSAIERSSTKPVSEFLLEI